MLTGGCHCGTIRYEISEDAPRHALCHCTDCRKSAGAPLVAWAVYPETAIKVVQGTAKVYHSSADGRRHFCPDCGTGLFYTNAVIFPNLIDLQTATLDDPDAVVAPSAQIQVADRIGWMKNAHQLPEFERYPEG
ncbi:GFA family protein [Sphingomonas sp. C3-2]|uniref:GFA family protein n=1 Tax=Sphingomonas sp. C3-2 TaxID=3062169 RepID=UPI00294B6BF8|nr:GFA family protein [Sphingomonas sp. C3-2]WOK36240.1 GFA family protein [Sphingomonas sp. C3-2]